MPDNTTMSGDLGIEVTDADGNVTRKLPDFLQTDAEPPGSKAMGGTNSNEFNTRLIYQAFHSNWLGSERDRTTQNDAKLAEVTVGGLDNIGPRDAVEGMLATQMFATHNAVMECHRRAMIPDQSFEVQTVLRAQAAKLSKSYAALVQAFDKHRGRGKQTVRVEHVHVHEGGQAIVGNVGGGATDDTMDTKVRRIGRRDDKPFSVPMPVPDRVATGGGR